MYLAMAALSGVAMAFVLLAVSLADIAAHPQLPGTHPDARFATLIAVGMGSDFSDGGVIQYGSVAKWVLPPDQPITAMATGQRRRIARADDSEDRVPLGIYSGTMFEALGVRMVGRPPAQPDLMTSLEGVAIGPAEIAVSEHIASRWFGSEAAALGQIVKIDAMLVSMGVEPVPFRISAVFDAEFRGPSSATQADVWIPLSAWPDVLLPGQQSSLLRTLPTRFVGALANDNAPALLTRIKSRMRDDSEARGKRLLALPGLGVEGHTRLVYARWAESLTWFAGALFVMLSGFVLTQRGLDLARRRGEDATRAALGEDEHRWWKRQSLQSARTISVAFSFCAATLGLAILLADRFSLPVAGAIRAIPTHPGSWLLIATFVGLIGWAPLARYRLLKSDSGTSERQLTRSARATIMLTSCVVAALAAVAVANLLSLNQLSDRELGLGTRQILLASRIESSADGMVPTSFDGRDASQLLADLAELNIAAATASPIDRVALVQGAHRFEGMPTQLLFGVNFVSANYFDVLGLRSASRCGPLAAFAPNQALVNAAFLRQFQLDASTTAPGLQLSAPGLNADLMYCGSVPDAQFDDVRADPRPTIYLPLKRLGDLQTLIAATNTRGLHDRAIATSLENHAADIAFKPWQSLAERIAEQLNDERSLGRSGLLALGLSLLLGVAICAFATLAAAEVLARTLAIRSAVGAPRWRLLLQLFFPGRVATRAAVVLVVSVICLVALRRFALEAPALGISLLGAMAAAGACVAAGVAFVLHAITEDRLRDWLANRN